MTSLATALTAAIAPVATPVSTKLDVALAADPTPLYVPQPAFGVGGIGGLITPLVDALGMNPFPLPLGLGGIAYDFSGGAPTTEGIYNLINGLDYKPIPTDISTCKNATQDQCRTAFVISTDYGALGATSAIQALIAGSQGTVLNFDPLRPAPGRFTGLTQVSGIYLLNILRANGGFDTRFPALVEPFGIKTTMPGVGETGPNKEGSSVFNWITDITWPYNTLSDFPVTLNPLSIANSIFAAVPPPALINLLTGSPEDAIAFLGSNTAGTVWGSAVGEGTSFALPTAAKCPGSCSNWGTLGVLSILGPVTGDAPGGGITGQSIVLDAADPYIPLTTPLRLNALVTNALLKRINSPYLMGTPLADILSPMLKILVNIGYDVVTPAKLDTVNPNPGAEGKTYAKQGYVAYDRTFAQDPFKPVPFNWFQNPSMTPEERKAVAGDAFTAFNDALAVQAQKPLFGLVVPNPDYNNTPITPPAAQAAPAPAAAVAPTESDIAAEAKAAVADSESAAPAAPSHRGGGPSAASSDSGGGASRDSGNAGGSGHRGAHSS